MSSETDCTFSLTMEGIFPTSSCTSSLIFCISPCTLSGRAFSCSSIASLILGISSPTLSVSLDISFVILSPVFSISVASLSGIFSSCELICTGIVWRMAGISFRLSSESIAPPTPGRLPTAPATPGPWPSPPASSPAAPPTAPETRPPSPPPPPPPPPPPSPGLPSELSPSAAALLRWLDGGIMSQIA